MATRLEHIGVAVPQCAARVLGKPIGVKPGRSLCVCADRATCASNQRMKSVHARPCGQPARQAYVLVRAGAPPGTRTPNPRIKRSTAGCHDRSSSTDVPSSCPECPRCPEIHQPSGPRPGPRAHGVSSPGRLRCVIAEGARRSAEGSTYPPQGCWGYKRSTAWKTSLGPFFRRAPIADSVRLRTVMAGRVGARRLPGY
jgi:hypothetical protein